MDQVSRPLIGLLVAVVAFFALWLVALKPGAGNTAASGPSTNALQSAVTKAHQAVATANAASARSGGAGPASAAKPPSAVGSAPSTATRAPSAASGAGQTAAGAGGATLGLAGRHRLNVVERALQANKVLALLFYNPSAADDQAVKQELALVPGHGGRVVALTIPIAELSKYSVVTNQVPVGVSPTLVVVDPDQQAQAIVGFADRFEIAQRVSDALRVP